MFRSNRGKEISKFKMLHCVIFKEKWPTGCNLYVQLVRDCMDATTLELMLVALARPVIPVKRHRSGTIFYDGYCLNFLQDTNSFIIAT